jgi:DUF4097 and DUF4098 domain-containing protein YvlB
MGTWNWFSRGGRKSRWQWPVLLAVAGPLFAAPADMIRTFRMAGNIDVDDAPSGASLTTMSGNINLKSVGHAATLKTYSGSIEIGAASGPVQATTMSGSIRIHLAPDDSDSTREISLRSMSGNITVYLPENFGAEADITLSYTKDYPGVARIIDDTQLPQTTSDKWEGAIGTPRRFVYARGKIGDGKNRITISTVNGDIVLRREPATASR